MARCPKCKTHVEMKPEQQEAKCPDCGAVLKRRLKRYLERYSGILLGIVVLLFVISSSKAGTEPIKGGACQTVILWYDAEDEGDHREQDEGPVHRVPITKPFYMGKYEVTQGEWDKIMGDNPSSFKGNDQLPVDTVSWSDCQKFLGKVGGGLRLPTEAEWEYACRAGSRGKYCFGSNEGQLGEYAWFEGNSGQQKHPVGQKKPNAWGLYDMHGNLLEWCQSLYKMYPYRDDDGRESLSAFGKRAQRGGGWYYYAQYCRSAFRGWGGAKPEDTLYTRGFRVVCVAASDTSSLHADQRVPTGFRAAPDTVPEPYTETGWAKEIIHEKTGIAMVFVPAGEFIMGSARDDGVFFYNEVTVNKSAAGTYFLVCGWAGGYFGLQELDDGKKLVLFSVWDSADAVGKSNSGRTTVIYHDRDVRGGRFGHEGTGMQCFFDYDWKVAQTYRFFVAGKIKGKRTEYTGYFYLPENKQWKKLVTFSKLTDGETNLRGYYSFIEDFKRSGVSTTWSRKAHFGNCWIRKTSGEWLLLNRATFKTDSNPAGNTDAGADGDRFFLATGGETQNSGSKWGELIDLKTKDIGEPPEYIRRLSRWAERR